MRAERKARKRASSGSVGTGQSTEQADLVLLGLAAAVIPLTWLLLLGLGIGAIIPAHDGLAGVAPYLRELLARRGDWTEVLYRPDLSGGVRMHDVAGTLPVFQGAALLGLPLQLALNLAVYLGQLCYAFLGVRAALDLWRCWRAPRATTEDFGRPGKVELLGALWLLAFAPVLAWKISYGHILLIYGSSLFLGAFALVAAVRAGTLSFTLCAVSAVAMAHALPSTGQQATLYGAVFGGPILLALILAPERSPRWLWSYRVPACVFLGALALSLPKFAGMWQLAHSTDAGRALGGESVIFSYITATLRDWWSSLPWSGGIVASGREEIFRHEVNYPFGPLLLLGAACFPWRQARGLGAVIFASGLAAILFSLDFKPVSEGLPALIPALKSFRVPHRAILPFALILPVLALAGLWTRLGVEAGGGQRRGQGRWALGVGALCLALLVLARAPATVREPAAWLVALGVILGGTARFAGWLRFLRPAPVLLVLGALSVAAFQERLLPFTRLNEARMGEIRKEILAAAPELEDPLVRARFDFAATEFATNTGMMLGFSTIQGYWYAPRRFLELGALLARESYHPTIVTYDPPETDPGLPVIRQLYNVCCTVRHQQGRFFVDRKGETAGAAWFSQQIQPLAGLPQLAEALRNEGPALARTVREKLWVLADDPKVAPHSIATLGGRTCAGARVLELHLPRGAQELRARLETPADCPLTLAMNYVESFEAEAIVGGQTRPVAVFPAYGALTGVKVPAGTTELRLRARAYLPGWAWAGLVAGVALWLLAAGLLWRARRA